MEKSSQPRGKKREITCACGCGRKRLVREADVKRGWGRFFSKRCKAVACPAPYLERYLDDDSDGSWEAHRCFVERGPADE